MHNKHKVTRIYVQNERIINGERLLHWEPFSKPVKSVGYGRKLLASWRDTFKLVDDKRPLMLGSTWHTLH